MSQKALTILKANLENRSSVLNLGYCGLTDDDFLPGSPLDIALKKCLHLKKIILSNNVRSSSKAERLRSKNVLNLLPSAITNLVNLVELNCSGDPSNKWGIRSLAPIIGLEKIKKICLNNNDFSDLEGLDSFSKLSILELKNNVINTSTWFEKLSSLKELYLDNNKLTETKGFQKLKQLEVLYLNNNDIKHVTSLTALKALQRLNLSDNKLTNLKGLTGIKGLVLLLLSRNKISNIRGIENLSKIGYLLISHNKLKIIDEIGTLSYLRMLSLRNNQIEDLSPLGRLNNLKTLDLRANKITSIEPILPLITRGDLPLKIVNETHWAVEDYEINILDNPIVIPPLSIIEEGTDTVIRYFKKLENEGEENVYEAKLILTGSGESGKTSLSLRLNNRNCSLPNKDDRTKEVQVNDYNFLIKDQKKFIAHIWDFGGQQVIHNFHRLFMNEDALYILITETSRENDDFDYWLQTIKLFGGDSPILFIQNKRNGIPRGLNIDKYKAYFNIKESLFNVNLLTNEGLDEVEEAIQRHIQQLPIVKRTIPKPWFLLRAELTSITQAYISYDEFVQICKNFGISSRVDIDDVGTFLHKLGIVLWYKDNIALRQKIILDKQWATKALFHLVFSEKINDRQKGYFTFEDAQLIWDSDNDYCHHASQLLSLMLEFKLAYKRRNHLTGYIIPALLTTIPPQKKFETPHRVEIVYQYTHLPKGIVNQLTAEMHDKIEKDEHAWNEGVWLTDGNTIAKIIENRFEKYVRIEIAGVQHREMFGSIKSVLDNIHTEYRGIKFELKIPCICDYCKNQSDKHFFNYNQIIKRLEEAKKLTIECVKSTEDVFLQELLDYLLPKKQQTKIEDIFDIIKTDLSIIHKANIKTHDGINMIKEKISEQNEAILDLIVLTKESRKELVDLLHKVDSTFDIAKAQDVSKSITNEISKILDILPKQISEEWKKLSNKAEDEVDIKTKLKLKIPIIPLIMDYETEWAMDGKKLGKKLRKFIF